jgi:hypothetical protein
MRNGIGKSFRDFGPDFPTVSFTAPTTSDCSILADNLPFVESDNIAARRDLAKTVLTISTEEFSRMRLTRCLVEIRPVYHLRRTVYDARILSR